MDYWWDILNLVLVFSIFAVSLNLLVGYAGQVSSRMLLSARLVATQLLICRQTPDWLSGQR